VRERRFRAVVTPRCARWERTESDDALDRTDANDAHEPTENAEQAEPSEPIDRNDPTEPIEKDEPTLPIEQNESLDHSDQPVRRVGVGVVTGTSSAPASWRRGPGAT
jgi:hypothetical protein